MQFEIPTGANQETAIQVSVYLYVYIYSYNAELRAYEVAGKSS